MTPTGAERPHRGTIFQETARILDHQDAGAGQWILRVQAPECAQRAAPGQFAHIQCSPNLPMRRPLSIQRVDREAGWVEFLYKVVGDGTQALSQQPVGDSLSVLGPIGVPFRLNPDRPLRLLLGGGVGIPPMVFLADHLRRQGEAGQTARSSAPRCRSRFGPSPRKSSGQGCRTGRSRPCRCWRTGAWPAA